jgi:hypothetical protein
MCSKKDIDIHLERLLHCHDHEERRRIIQQIDTCVTCSERTRIFVQEDSLCSCEVFNHAELRNIIEHARQYSIYKEK